MPSIPLFWLFRGYLKEDSEGHRDAAALCLFKNMDVKVCVGERMKVMGGGGGERARQLKKRPIE